MQAVILAGGRGERLRPLTDYIPKAMVPIRGRPFLEYELENLKANGIDDVVLCVGYKAEVIRSHFGKGEDFGLRIRYSYDGEQPLGTMGALKNAEGLLEDAFFVTYGDNYLRLDYRGMMHQLLSSDKLGVMAVYHNNGLHGKSDVEVDSGYVTYYDKEDTGHRSPTWINYGIISLRKQSLSSIPGNQYYDEERFYNKLIEQRQLIAYEAHQRFYEIGTVNSLTEFEENLEDILGNQGDP
ncbi:MAG: sugar phosphate nucleotidyltransferase [Candidatus Bathyarchaeota archaeon]|nr:sugar phosphate nucleotidyltransferase [Candidatus Bathyarchaeota archaeon]